MVNKFIEWLKGVDWWVVSAGVFLLAAGIITGFDLFDGTDNALFFRNTVSWLNSAAAVCALFSIRDSIFGLRRENLRRAYDPDIRK